MKKLLGKIKEGLKIIFEGNKCRFAPKCKHYRDVSACCNRLSIRFPFEGTVYCGTYRGLEEKGK